MRAHPERPVHRRRSHHERSRQAKGRVKQAAGDLTGDDDLRREGKVDESAGKAKDKLGDLKDKAEDVIDSVKDKVTGKTCSARAPHRRHHDGRAVHRRGVPVTHDHELEVPFADRRAAGAALAALPGRASRAAPIGDPVVVALPRGGVPVAAVVAERSTLRST